LLALAEEMCGIAVVVARRGPYGPLAWWRVTGQKIGIPGVPAPCVPFDPREFVRPVGAKGPQSATAAQWGKLLYVM
jgi:hypothetical protein